MNHLFVPRNAVFASLAIIAAAGAWLALLHRVPEQPQLALFHQEDFVPQPDGTLIRALGEARVYYVEGGRKHWIDSAQTFQVHGFRAEDVRELSAAEVARYPDGEPIGAHSNFILPRERNVLPDLAPLAAYDVRLSTVGGRTVVRFTGSFWNRGRQQFELASDPTQYGAGVDGYQPVFQRIVGDTGQVRSKLVGNFLWHEAHRHYHYGDFAEYVFTAAQMAPGSPAKGNPSVRQKTTFCLRDDQPMGVNLPGSPLHGVFVGRCTQHRQGVSVGWIDVYASTLPDQYIDVHDMPPGIYALSFFLDPNEHFVEERRNNNISTTFLELDVQRGIVRVIAALAPFPTTRNTFADGTLVTTRNTGNVYVLQHGTKRWLRSVDIFNSYGYSWGSIYPVTEAMVDSIPSQMLVRRAGTQEVFVVNEHGYRRHIMGPQVFASYGFTAVDVAQVSALEFAAYPEGNLIIRAGDEQVYEISGQGKRAIGTLASLQASGRDLRGLHLVNETDFAAYPTIQ